MGQKESACAWGLEKKLWYVHMTCHIVCGGGETKPPCKFYTGKKRPKKGKD